MDKPDTTPLSRRTVFSTASLGLAAAAVAAPALAQTKPSLVQAAPNPPVNEAPAVPLQDPRTKFPQPPFVKQSQPWPGLARDMQPKPDHGETSYKGSGRLAGRRALITGGDSGMGRAAAIAFAREGADVAINYLPEEEPDAQEVVALIQQAGRKAVAIPGDLRQEAFCNQLVAQAVQALGGLDILVSNAARQQFHASILDIGTEDFDATIEKLASFGCQTAMGRPGQP